jgi:hypothetical protein
MSTIQQLKNFIRHGMFYSSHPPPDDGPRRRLSLRSLLMEWFLLSAHLSQLEADPASAHF